MPTFSLRPKTIFAVAAIAVASAGLAAAPALAKETADMHQQARYGGKTCFVTHSHHGEGNMPSRKGAERAAIRRWTFFTKWEYGPLWGSYAKARGKRMNCQRSGSRWTCMTDAYPCRGR
ncbi:MAG: hypothetical protein AAFO62_00125 [Pseudomonadota bacterium]